MSDLASAVDGPIADVLKNMLPPAVLLGNGNPLQYSCLNAMDRGTSVHRFTKS